MTFAQQDGGLRGFEQVNDEVRPFVFVFDIHQPDIGTVAGEDAVIDLFRRQRVGHPVTGSLDGLADHMALQGRVSNHPHTGIVLVHHTSDPA